MKAKKLLFYFLFLLLLQSTYSSAYNLCPADTLRLHPVEKKAKHYPLQPIIIKTSPTSMLWGSIILTAEYKLVVEIPSSKNQAMQLGISYLGKSPIMALAERQASNGTQSINYVFSGYSIQLANKFYLVRQKYGSPFGFYFAPQVVYSNAHISLTKSRAYRKTYIDATQFSASMIAGVQIGRGKRLTADLFWGLGYKKNTWTYHINTFRVVPYDTSDLGGSFLSSVKVTFGLNLGWAIY